MNLKQKIQCDYCDYCAPNWDDWHSHQLTDHSKHSPYVSPSMDCIKINEDLIYLQALIDSLGFFCEGNGFDLWEQVQNKYEDIVIQFRKIRSYNRPLING